jgi:hypothetical protein
MFNYRLARWVALAPVLAASTLSLAATKPRGGTPMCAVAAEWVKTHKGSLPASLVEFSRYPLAYRQAVWGALSAPVRERLWREHFSAYAKSHSLTEDQNALLTLMSARVGDYVDEPTGAAGRAAIRRDSVAARVDRVFGPSEGRKLMNLVASPQTVSGYLCDCSTEFYLDDPNCEQTNTPYCNSDGACDPYPFPACGEFMEFTCDGTCGS